MRKELDMLNGTLWNKILMFALPLAASSMLQQLFNSADVAIVGRFAGKEALAAVGSNGSLIALIINVFVGLSIGASVTVAKYIGSGEKEKVSNSVHTSILVAVISGTALIFVGLAASKVMLRLMETPEDVIDLAAVYLRIYFIGMPFFMVYNFGAAILRSIGDTRRPLIILLISGVINVILNVFFVRFCHLSVAGVAIATVIANIISAFMVVHILMNETDSIRLELKKLKISKKILWEIVKIGVPAGIQGVVFSISNVIIQAGINSLGSLVVAGSAAALNYEYFAYYLLNAFAQASTTFVSQNFGAMQLKRCSKAVLISTAMAVTATFVFCAVCVIFSDQFLRIYTKDGAVMEFGLVRMQRILIFQCINAIFEVLAGGMRGAGYSLVPALIPIAGICGFRLLWVYTVFEKYREFEVLVLAYPISWVLTSVTMIIAYVIVWSRINKQFAEKSHETVK
ncbi:MAG: MATE family efflux transporter [Firmicutes bacterium]|nr:MATE family efflux transporter [Bacillota bacterium]